MSADARDTSEAITCALCQRPALGQCLRCGALRCSAHKSVGGSCCADCELRWATVRFWVRTTAIAVGTALAGVGAIFGASMWGEGWNSHAAGSVVVIGALAFGGALVAMALAWATLGILRRWFVRSGPGGGDARIGEFGDAIDIDPHAGPGKHARKRRHKLRPPKGDPPELKVRWWR